jgi:ABC-type glutathione transport system ATPase component
MNVLEVEKLCLGIHGSAGTRPIVINLSFAVGQGEIFGLTGPNGVGKSLAGAAASGVLPGAVQVLAGTIHLFGDIVEGGGRNQWQHKRGYQVLPIFQSSSQALNPALTIQAQMVETLGRIRGYCGKKSREKAIELLARVGLSKTCLKSYPFELSGGMRQRVLIALAYGLKPGLIVADEPTTGLDPINQKKILDLLLRLKTRHQISILFISHDLQAVAYLADQIAVMTAKGISECQTPELLLKHPESETGRILVRSFSTLMGKEIDYA